MPPLSLVGGAARSWDNIVYAGFFLFSIFRPALFEQGAFGQPNGYRAQRINGRCAGEE